MLGKLPNFESEWEEAIRYPEFVKLGKRDWINLVSRGKKIRITSAAGINNTDASNPKSFFELDSEKVKRALGQIENGVVEMPIVAEYANGIKELIGGNTRLTGMLLKYGYADIWLFKVK